MAYISTENIFVSGTVARASKVNENFDSITSGLYNGTKDLNMANIATNTLTATTATIGSLSFDDILAEDVTANGNLSVISENHEMALSCPGVSGLIKIDSETVASFKGDVTTLPSINTGAGTFSDNVSITSGTEKYLSVSQTGESSGEVKVTPYGIGTVAGSNLNLKTNDTTRVVINGTNGRVSVGGDFTALSPLHVSGNIRASGALINGNISVSGFSNLGELSPAIKQKLISGVLTTIGATTGYPLGMAANKVLAVNVFADRGSLIPPGYENLVGEFPNSSDGYRYDMYTYSTNLHLS